MKDPKKLKDETVSSSYDRLPLEYDEKEVTAQLIKIHAALQNQPLKDVEMDRLANALTIMSVLMVNLGQMVIDARLYAEACEEFRKSAQREIYLQYKESGETDQTSRTKAESEVESYLEDEMKARHGYNTLSNFRDDLDRFISTAQSRIKTVAGDRIRSNME